MSERINIPRIMRFWRVQRFPGELLLAIVLFLTISATISAILSGCDNPLAAYTGQDFGSVAWMPDGSGLVGLFERYDATSTGASQIYSFGLFNTDGSVNNTITTTDQNYATSEFSPKFFLSQDSKTAIVQLGIANPNANLYAVDLTTGTERLISSKVNLLGCSPDLQYAVVSPSPLGTQPRITISILNIAANPVYVVKNFDVTNVNTSSGALWLANGKFAITLANNPWQINIYDTTGTLLDSLQNEQLLFGQGSYVPKTGDLYCLSTSTSLSGLDRYNVTTRQRPPQHIYAGSDAVSNFDVSSDGTLAAIQTNTGLWALNTNGSAKRTLITSDISWGAWLSPDAKHVAYIHQQSGNTNFYEIYVAPITLPQ